LQTNDEKEFFSWLTKGLSGGWLENTDLEQPVIENDSPPSQVRPELILSCGIIGAFGAIFLTVIGGSGFVTGISLGVLVFGFSLFACIGCYQHAYLTIDDSTVCWETGFIPFMERKGWQEPLQNYEAVVIHEIKPKFDFFNTHNLKAHKATRPSPNHNKHNTTKPPETVMEVALWHKTNPERTVSLACFPCECVKQLKDFAKSASRRFNLPIATFNDSASEKH